MQETPREVHGVVDAVELMVMVFLVDTLLPVVVLSEWRLVVIVDLFFVLLLGLMLLG
jgi:hypothetical protein